MNFVSMMYEFGSITKKKKKKTSIMYNKNGKESYERKNSAL